MYNRYIPEDSAYTWTQPPPSAPPSEAEQGTRRGWSGLRLPDFLTGREGTSLLAAGKESLSGLLKALHLENIDPGDILLLLIVLYLLVEGDDLELVIALGLVLLIGLGD